MEPGSGPLLEPRQRNEGTWYAHASWPNAPTQDVGYFKSASDVREWIAKMARAYFEQRAGL